VSLRVQAIVGDITPFDGVPKATKKQLEDEAMKKMIAELGNNPFAHEIYALFSEYEHQETEEAKFVKEVDKLEMILQGDFYERTQATDLSQFFDSTPVDGFTHPLIKGVAKELLDARNSARLAPL
jgi:putative hydrolase of HD superfamily